MNRRMMIFGALAAILMLSISAFAQGAHENAPQKPHQFYIRSVYYIITVKQCRGCAASTSAVGEAMTTLNASTSPLDGGIMNTTRFEEELKHLVATGKVEIASRPSGIVGAGTTLNLAVGSQYVELAPGTKAGPVQPNTGLYSPLLYGEIFNVHVEPTGEDGTAAALDINNERSEPEAGGVFYRTALKTSVTLHSGETAVYGLGPSPDNKRLTFFAISAAVVR